MTRYLTLREGKIEYQLIEASHNESLTLVFLHEGLGCVSMWKDFPEKLAENTGCNALVYSRFGYGRSDPCDLPRTRMFMHEEGLDVLPRIIEQTGIRDHILIGHSDGGSIALIYAGGLDPAPLKGVVSIAAHVFCEQITVDSIRKARTEWENGKLKKKLHRYHMENTETAFTGWNNVWLDPSFMDWNIEKYLSRIDVPVLAVQGQEDPYGTRSQVESIVTNCAGPATPLLIPGCGHAPHIEKTTLLLDVLSDFIRNPDAPVVDKM